MKIDFPIHFPKDTLHLFFLLEWRGKPSLPGKNIFYQPVRPPGFSLYIKARNKFTT